MTLAIKICGLTGVGDASAALAAGADFLGFVLYPKSPRFVTAARLRHIVAALPASARVVGVFVNTPAADVARTARACRLAAVQVHGDEAAADFSRYPVPVWRAVHLSGTRFEPDPAAWAAARYVIDAAAAPGQYGGTGTRADWSRAAAFAGQWPSMLAGGLTPENVAEAIRQVRPLGVDVTSGVEARPGRKDPEQVRRFITAARAAAH